MTALALMGLLPAMGRVSGGQILFKGEDLMQHLRHGCGACGAMRSR